MALPRTQWYVSSVGYAAITAWATGATIAAGALRRQLAAPSAGNERIFIAIIAGTTHATTEPTWVVTRGARTTDNTVTWQEVTGQAAVNGDITNTVAWSHASIKNTAITLGAIIKNVAATHYFICSVAGTAGNAAEPTWNTTTGVTTADNTVTWTCIGTVGTFTGGLAPHNRIVNALTATWAVSGDTICVADNHAYTVNGSITYSNASATPFNIICHNRGAYPPTSSNLTTGATETSTASFGACTFNAQSLFTQGIEFICNGSNGGHTIGNSGNSTAMQRYKNCKFTCGASAISDAFYIGTSANSSAPNIYLDNVTFKFGAGGQRMRLYSGNVVWENGSVDAGGTAPSNLILGNAGNSANAILLVRGVDLSFVGAGTLIHGGNFPTGQITFMDCKLGASTVIATVGTAANAIVDLVNCSSGAVNYRNERYTFSGTLTTETTIIRTGGASDGTTSISFKIITTSTSTWLFPFEAPPIAIWNETVGSAVTITLYGIWGGGAVPNNDDFWINVIYQGSTLTPIASLATSGKADLLATGTALSSDSSTWGGSTTKFKTSVTITPQQKGYIYVHPRMAKISSTLYYDPELEIT